MNQSPTMATKTRMQSTRLDSSQDVSSNNDLQDQDGSQVLDSKNVNEMLEKHKAAVGIHLKPVI
jgi:hypothetical protein